MKMCFRWYGPSDPITLAEIRQIPGVEGIVSSAFEVPADQVIPPAVLSGLKERIHGAGFAFDCFESIPVHEEIKLAGPERDRYIDIWLSSLRNVAEIGVTVVCYNFMLAFDWLRTDLTMPLADGSAAMCYKHQDLATLDLTRELPAWSQKYTADTLKRMLDRSREIDEKDLWANLRYFLQAVVPTAENLGVKLAIHPDDPPWPVLGICRPISSLANLQRFVDLVDSPANGLAICSGSLGANPANDIPTIIRTLGKKIHFLHVRNLRHVGPQHFYETAHVSSSGSLDMYAIMKAARDIGFDGPLRPDHGRDIWGERRIPGYGLYDRALGVTYLLGLWEAICKSEAEA